MLGVCCLCSKIEWMLMQLILEPKAEKADIVIGIRSYEVLFEGSTMHGKQAGRREIPGCNLRM